MGVNLSVKDAINNTQYIYIFLLVYIRIALLC